MAVSEFDTFHGPSVAPREPRARRRRRHHGAGDRRRHTLGERAQTFVEELGRMSALLGRTAAVAMRRPFELRELARQIEQLGVRSIGITVVTAVFTAAVMTVQLAYGLERFGGRDYVSRIIGMSLTRELAPALTALVVGSRIAAGMAAELGSMAVTEQLDAIRALGADPIKKLVLPRVLACLILLPVLGLFADLIGFVGAMIVSRAQFGTPYGFFLITALDTVQLVDLFSGLGKLPFFGLVIALIGCHFGLQTRGGTEGVGRATTRAVVVTSVSVLLTDFFLSKLFIIVWPA